MNIQRRVYNYEQFKKSYPKSIPVDRFSVLKRLGNFWKKQCKPSGKCLSQLLFDRLPFIQIFHHYKKTFLMTDIITGIEVNISVILINSIYSLLNKFFIIQDRNNAHSLWSLLFFDRTRSACIWNLYIVLSRTNLLFVWYVKTSINWYIVAGFTHGFRSDRKNGTKIHPP